MFTGAFQHEGRTHCLYMVSCNRCERLRMLLPSEQIVSPNSAWEGLVFWDLIKGEIAGYSHRTGHWILNLFSSLFGLRIFATFTFYVAKSEPKQGGQRVRNTVYCPVFTYSSWRRYLWEFLTDSRMSCSSIVRGQSSLRTCRTCLSPG